jgi:hypothetical protein
MVGEATKGLKMRLLAERESSGVLVRLFWDDTARACDPEVVVEYEDRSQDVIFTLYPPGKHALDAFYHPNAYRESTRSWTRFSVRV